MMSSSKLEEPKLTFKECKGENRVSKEKPGATVDLLGKRACSVTVYRSSLALASLCCILFVHGISVHSISSISMQISN